MILCWMLKAFLLGMCSSVALEVCFFLFRVPPPPHFFLLPRRLFVHSISRFLKFCCSNGLGIGEHDGWKLKIPSIMVGQLGYWLVLSLLNVILRFLRINALLRLEADILPTTHEIWCFHDYPIICFPLMSEGTAEVLPLHSSVDQAEDGDNMLVFL